LENFPFFLFFLFFSFLFFSSLFPPSLLLPHACTASTNNRTPRATAGTMELQLQPRPPPMESLTQARFSSWDGQKRIYIYMTSLLLSPPLILSETNSNLRILRDSIFQLNSDFISNSNLNPFGLLPHPYISLCPPLPCIPMPIPPQNCALASPKFHLGRRCPSSPLPLF
jgi:hypothetical protein